MGGRTIVIGDVHGCIGELEDLLQKVNVRPSDKVVFVGDLVDRGPDSAAVVALAMQHMAIRGWKSRWCCLVRTSIDS